MKTMNKFALIKDSEGSYHVCKSKILKKDEKNNEKFILDNISVSVIYFNDDQRTLDELCKNLNLKSPSLKLIDTVRAKKPIIIEDKTLPKPRVLKFSRKEYTNGNRKQYSSSGESEYQPTDQEYTSDDQLSDDDNCNNQTQITTDNQDTRCKSKRRVTQPITRKTWTKEEEKDFNYHFEHYLKTKTLPGLLVVRSIQSEFGVLKNRTPEVINAHVFNKNQKAKSATNFDDKKSDKTHSHENRIQKHLKYIFQDCIEKKKVPALDACAIAKRTDKLLCKLSDTNIQRRIS
ncbi:Protein of unknown function [Cotesia congregata]|uniref:Uncharacterized protein n=1 Tax=Cotesia congregata TaxID=51543 RepID=A0A8J2HAR2_COTCN|nr:Protein of unknown function [Cotesia congregata]